jgi:hypothetical protein
MPDSPTSAAEPLQAVALTPPQQELVKLLRNSGGPLFAVLDATREPLSILGLLRASGEEYQSLYEGTQAQVLEAFAPYLVRLTENSKLLENVIVSGWGKNWEIFAVSGADFQAVRKHFRTFLMVKGPNSQRLYFRYYDPRVLRVYFPTCNAAEAQFVFGPVTAYFCEGETPNTLLAFRPGPEAPREESIKFTGVEGKQSEEPIILQTQDTESLRTALASS